MFRILTYLGIGGIGYALFNYYNKQLKLALDWKFKIKKFRVKGINKDGAKLQLLVSILNKSSFELTVKNYNINILYKGVVIGQSTGEIPFKVSGDSWFDVAVDSYIPFSSAKGVLDNVGVELITGKPIKVDIVGNMNVEFASVSREVEFNVRDYVVSQNLADEVGIGKPIDKVKGILEDIGIKF